MVAPGARGCESRQGDAEGMTARGPGMAAGGIRGDGREGSDGKWLPPPQAVDVGLPLLRFPLSLLPAAIPECGPSNASPQKRPPCKDCGTSSTPPNITPNHYPSHRSQIPTTPTRHPRSVTSSPSPQPMTQTPVLQPRPITPILHPNPSPPFRNPDP